MNLKHKVGAMVGTVLVAGSILAAGAVYAADNSADPSSAPPLPFQGELLDKAVESGRLSQAEADLLKQLGELRKAAMDKLRSDSKAIIDQAVQDGKITQEQAEKLGKFPGGGPHIFKWRGPGPEMKRMGPDGAGLRMWGGAKPFFRAPLTEDDLKAKLDAAVEAGKLTREQADKMLEQFAQHQAKREQRAE